MFFFCIPYRLVANSKKIYFNFSSTNEDEMCNFYLMYYVDGEEPLEMKFCGSRGPPSYYWNNPENDLNNIPDIEASRL